MAENEQNLKVLDKNAIKELEKNGWKFLKLNKIREDSDVCERLGLEYLNGRAPAYGERAWFGINEEKGLLIVVWDTGNGTCSLLEIAIKKGR